MDALPLSLLVFLIVVAVIAGLWVGGRANREVETRKEEGKSWSARIRDATGRAAVSVFKWNRDRKRNRARDRDDE